MTIKTLLLIGIAMVISGCATSSKPVEPIPKASVETLLQQGAQAEKIKQWELALRRYVEALEQQPESAEILYRIGRTQAELKHNDFATKAFKDALTQQPDHAGALTELALLKLKLGDTAQAASYLDKAINLDQKRLLSANKQVIIEGSTELHPIDNKSPTEAYNGKGILNDLKGEHSEAKRLFLLILNQQPDNAAVLTNLGYSYYLEGNLRQAEIQLRLATQKQPDFKRAWHNLGLVYARMNHYQRAIVALKRVMPEADALNDLGYFAMLEGRYDKAQELFHQAIDSSPTYFAKAQDNLEQLRELQGKATIRSSHQSGLPLTSAEALVQRPFPLSPSAQ